MPDWNHLTEDERNELIAAVTHTEYEFRWNVAVAVYDKAREILARDR